MISPRAFFFFFLKILIFQHVSCVKGQKIAENDKKLCLSHSISQEAYKLWKLQVQACVN